MRLAIYFSDDAIQVLAGRRGKYPKIAASCLFPLKSGTLINDITAKEEEVKEVLMAVRDQFPKYADKVTLVLGNSQILIKVMVVPSLGNRQLLEIVRRELQTSYHITEDMVYDYSTLKEKNSNNKGGTILGIAVKRHLIEYYEQLFKECGIKLREVDITLNAIISLVRRIPGLDKKTYILSVIDGRNIMSVVFNCGEYTYVNRHRVVNEPNSYQAGYELVNHLTTLIQFNRIQKRGEEIEEILICGVRKENEEKTRSFLQREMNYNTEIDFLNSAGSFRELIDLGYRLSDYPYVTGTLCKR